MLPYCPEKRWAALALTAAQRVGTHDPDCACTHDVGTPCRYCSCEPSAPADTRTTILAALRAELPTFSCYEPARLIGTPCSCVVGMARAIEIVEGLG